MPSSRDAKLAALREALANYTPDAPKVDPEVAEEKARVRARALALLNQRARSRAELCQRLSAAEFSPLLIAEVVADLERVNLVDDVAFAHEWVRQRHAGSGKSAAVLDRELRDKGVSAEIRVEALAQVTPDSEEEIAWQLARKKARSIKEVPADYQERDRALRRIVGVLGRRGFAAGLSMRIARQALEERLAELGL